MHTATQLSAGQFTAEVAGRPATLADVLPRWSDGDRLGIVVRQPFGALGASVLVQAVVATCYDHDPGRRGPRAQYPETYLVHVGGRWGDHSMLDFWPARKECFVDADPVAVLGALNDRGVTRLLVPDAEPRPVDFGTITSAGFSEAASARDRVVQAWAYDASGTVRGGDVLLRATGAAAADNALAALDPEGLVDDFALSPPSALDDQGWRDSVVARAGEVEQGVRTVLAERFRASVAGGARVESYRRLEVDDALAMLV